MIHSTFYRLDQQKRGRILRSARREFSKGPLSAARISHIVSGAGIPRGSFYQYFDAVEDVLEAVWDDIIEQKQDLFLSFFKEARGDVFAAALLIFKNEYAFFSDPRNRTLAATIFKMDIFAPGESVPLPVELNGGSSRTMLQMIDTAALKSGDPEFISNVVTLTANCVKENIRTGIKNKVPAEEAARITARQLEILRCGAEDDGGR
jgi:AcrR family transcriptional regulator